MQTCICQFYICQEYRMALKDARKVASCDSKTTRMMCWTTNKIIASLLRIFASCFLKGGSPILKFKGFIEFINGY